MTALPDRRVVIPALGITQILAWGSTFYLLAVLAPLIARDTGWTFDLIVGGVSVGLFVAGLAAPRVGRLIAQKGGRPVLAIGAVLMAAGHLGIGLAPNLACYFAGWVLIGLGMSAGLYDAAFATLGRIYASQARSAITAVTLFGGFASTVCWPLSAILAAQVGWRGTCIAYAAIQIAIALPIHLSALPSATTSGTDMETKRPPVKLDRTEWVLFALLAGVLTISVAILAIVGTHLLLILTARGVDMAVAVALGTIIGPAQVGARVIEMVAGSRYHPVWTMIASAVLVAIAAAMLFFNFPIAALAVALYGAGNGIGSVARGTLPLALFGPDRYPVLTGRIAFPLLVAMAVSPFLAGLAFQRGGADLTLGFLTALAFANVALVGMLWAMTRRRAE
jgi:predicted MFS family arabinose efflux permease